MNVPTMQAPPSSHIGWRSRSMTPRPPAAGGGAATLATCRVVTLTALHNAASRAKTITTQLS